jgi:hypothetical protein
MPLPRSPLNQRHEALIEMARRYNDDYARRYGHFLPRVMIPCDTLSERRVAEVDFMSRNGTMVTVFAADPECAVLAPVDLHQISEIYRSPL